MAFFYLFNFVSIILQQIYTTLFFPLAAGNIHDSVPITYLQTLVPTYSTDCLQKVQTDADLVNKIG